MALLVAHTTLLEISCHGSIIDIDTNALPRVALSLVVANKKGTDLLAHPRSLISAFVNRLLESIISRCATSKNLIF